MRIRIEAAFMQPSGDPDHGPPPLHQALKP
jgi:hypothetical protein